MSEGRPLPRTYRAKSVQELFGFSHATLYDQMAKGKFPRPNIQIGERAVGWTEDILQAEQARRIAERSDGIRQVSAARRKLVIDTYRRTHKVGEGL